MEVEVLSVDGGAPEGTIVSIRAGSSRRQAPISALGKNGKPFHFASGPAGMNPFKLDLLQELGSARMALPPGNREYTVPIKGGPNGNLSVSFAVREVTKHSEHPMDLFDQLDANKDGVISRSQFAGAMRVDGDKPVLQPLDSCRSRSLQERGGAAGLPPLPKDEDGHFPAAAAAAKEYLEGHNLLPFVRALLQTVVRERPSDPITFIADQFRNAAGAATVLNNASDGQGEGGGPPPVPPPRGGLAGAVLEEANGSFSTHLHTQASQEANEGAESSQKASAPPPPTGAAMASLGVPEAPEEAESRETGVSPGELSDLPAVPHCQKSDAELREAARFTLVDSAQSGELEVLLKRKGFRNSELPPREAEEKAAEEAAVVTEEKGEEEDQLRQCKQAMGAWMSSPRPQAVEPPPEETPLKAAAVVTEEKGEEEEGEEELPLREAE